MRRALRFLTPVFVVFSLVAFGGERDGLRASDPGDPASIDDIDDDTDDDDEDAADDDAPALASVDAGTRKRRGGCPSTMLRVHDFCIDRYEAPDRRGAKPLVMQSANEADAWCAAHRKRLCTEDEWIGACEGENHRAYPYGNDYVEGRCNDDKPWKEVNEATLAKWPAPEAQAHAKELYQAAPSGSKHKCVSQAGVHDLAGNVEEWVVRTREHANGWPYILAGCYWSGCYGGGKPTCHSTNNAHGPEFRFYETGFRCCRDVGVKR